MNRLLMAAVVFVVLSPAAFAQGNSATGSTSQGTQNIAPLPQEIAQKLQSAGYSDVKVMPTSFFVQAKDKQGDPVEILITPHSMMEVTALNVNEQGDIASSANSNSASGNR
jgi:hypothetical protein